MSHEGNNELKARVVSALESLRKYGNPYAEGAKYRDLSIGLKQGYITVHDLINARYEALREKVLSELEWVFNSEMFTNKRSLDTVLLKKGINNKIITADDLEAAVKKYKRKYVNLEAVELGIRKYVSHGSRNIWGLHNYGMVITHPHLFRE